MTPIHRGAETKPPHPHGSRTPEGSGTSARETSTGAQATKLNLASSRRSEFGAFERSTESPGAPRRARASATGSGDTWISRMTIVRARSTTVTQKGLVGALPRSLLRSLGGDPLLMPQGAHPPRRRLPPHVPLLLVE